MISKNLEVIGIVIETVWISEYNDGKWFRLQKN